MAGQEKVPQSKPALGSLAEIVHNLRLAWVLYMDRRVPFWVKGIPLVALGYVLWPVDLLPDFIPALGQVDDLTLIVLSITAFISLCPGRLVEQHRQKIRGEHPADAETVDTTYRVLDEEPWK